MDTYKATKLTPELLANLIADDPEINWTWLVETLRTGNVLGREYYFVPDFVNKYHTTPPHGCAIRADYLEEEFNFVFPENDTDTFEIIRK